MIEARAVVLRVDGGSAWVKVNGQGGCGRCDEPGGCGGARIAHAFGRPDEVFRVDAGQLSAGQRVVLRIEDGVALGAALVSYGLPTAGAIVGVAAGSWAGGEPGALLGLAAGLTGAWLAMRHLAARHGWTRRLSVSVRAEEEACGHASTR